jgi:photosystem II stability/assembly factor-like uncharacterized protein
LRAILLLPLLFVFAPPAVAQRSTSTVELNLARVEGLKWRQIGPFRGGRSLAAAGSVARPKEFYFGATGGGLWKSVDAGANWKPVSDGFFGTASVGAVAISASNPDVVYAGTGERDIRGNISHGDGVYKTTDGGKTWRNIGLGATQTISKIAVHPTNPDIAYVAALGPVYAHPGVAASNDRGVYKTTNGGNSWNKVLDGLPFAGAVDLKMDPSNPDVLLASTWEAWRSPYMLNSGGPGSRLWKSTNGGSDWTDLTRRPGLPTGLVGKIGVTISPADPKRYWAIVESTEGGIFRTDDAGETWQKTNDNRNYRQRAWYYNHLTADPKDRDTVYVLNVGIGKSTDGGKTFSGFRGTHGDNHDLWVAPDDPNRIINANDGGASVTLDGGKTWSAQDMPTAQMYHVSTENAFPYRILGAQQDNSTVRIPSRTTGAGIRETDWTSTAGGESGYVSAKPDRPDLVFGGSYGGDLSWFDHGTQQSRSVDPWPDNPMGHGAKDLVHRFQWTYPIVFSPHNPNELYVCSQYVLKSTNLGQSWKRISPDLTRNERSTMEPSGGPITKDNTSVEYYGTVFTLAESPVKRGVLWAGSDDGLIHVSQNGGKSWTNVTPSGMPRQGLVSMIEASPFAAGTAFAAVDHHENNDYAPYAYRTDDFGKTWTKIVNGFPRNTFLRVIREDRRVPGLLYAGTETGIFISGNGGARWQPFSLNLPLTPVHDLAWKEDDLIAATHGRGFWVLDDLSPIQALAAGRGNGDTVLFPPRAGYNVFWGGNGGSKAGENPPGGLVLNYFLAAEAKEVQLTVTDAKGEVVAKLNPPKSAGFHRVSTGLQYPSWTSVPRMILWGAFPSPITAPPGKYTVTLTVGGVKQSVTAVMRRDPRSIATDADLIAQTKFLREVAASMTEANQAIVRIRKFRTKIEEMLATAPSAETTAFVGQLTAVEEALYQTKNQSGQDPLNYPIRLNNRIGALFNVTQNGDGRPTAQAVEVFRGLKSELAVQTKQLATLLGKSLADLNGARQKAGLPPLEEPKL